MLASFGGSMRSDAPLVARHVDRVPRAPEHRTVLVSLAGLLGLGGVVLFGIGLVEVWGGIWSALGFVVCVAIVSVAGFDVAPSRRRGSAGGHRRAAVHAEAGTH
jgi:hypothetical protein